MTTARIGPRWVAPTPSSTNRGAVALVAGISWLLLLLVGLALLLG